MTGIGENTLAQPVKPPLRERRACLAKLVKNRLTLTEGIRDLAGAHDGATARLATAKQRLLAFLAKRGFVYGGTTPAGNPRKYWTYDFLRWLDKVRPEDDGGVRTLAALRNEVEAAAEARADLLSEYRAAVDASPIAAEVAALQSIKGCAFALAAAFSAEVGDFTRFRSRRQVTAYFGLAPLMPPSRTESPLDL